MRPVSDLNFERHFQEWYKKSFCIYLYRRVFVSFIVNNSLVNDEQNYKSFFDEQFQKYYMLLRIVFKLVPLPDRPWLVSVPGSINSGKIENKSKRTVSRWYRCEKWSEQKIWRFWESVGVWSAKTSKLRNDETIFWIHHW